MLRAAESYFINGHNDNRVLKLAAIYNVWDGEELLKGSIDCIKNDVDLFIIVWQDVSNYGEKYDPFPEILDATEGLKVIYKKFTPEIGIGFTNEKKKRQEGIDIALREGCTHFIHMDCDEFYQDFNLAKQHFILSGADGSVCPILTYFKLPTLRFENPDNYFVPFIHKLRPETLAGVKEYPFYVDPTRKINVKNVVQLPYFMHHFSYVRRDIERKCRNSSAKMNIEKSDLLKDYHSKVGVGSFIKDFRQKLIQVDDYFGINPTLS